MGVTVEDKQSTWRNPEDGDYLAVVADIVDLGPVQTKFGLKDKVQIVFLLDSFDSETGDQFRVSGFYTKSKHEKSGLRKAVKAIVGYDAFETEGSIDLDDLLLGKNVRLAVENSEGKEGKEYCNIVAILKAPKGKVLEVPADFQRKADKDGVGTSDNPVNRAPAQRKPATKAPAKKATPAPAPAAVAEVEETIAPEVADEDIPF